MSKSISYLVLFIIGFVMAVMVPEILLGIVLGAIGFKCRDEIVACINDLVALFGNDNEKADEEIAKDDK